MILSETVEVIINSKTFKKYKELGFDVRKNGQTIQVPLNLVSKGSHAKVNVKCDFCRKIYTSTINDLNRGKAPEIHACRDCCQKKKEWVFRNILGVENASQLPGHKEKCIKTSLERYGTKSPLQSQQIKNKIIKTNIEKYGVPCSALAEEVTKKRMETNIKKYGTPYAIESKEVRKKIQKTFIEKYGTPYITQNDDVMTKILKTKYMGKSQISSKQQRKLCDVLNGELNYPFKRFYIDIAMLDKKIAIEYNGGGHNLSVRLGYVTEKEFNRNENFRRKMLFEDNWLLIEYISPRNRILKDEDIIGSYRYCLELFSKGKHYIKVYIDENKICSGNDKICYRNTLNDWNEETP